MCEKVRACVALLTICAFILARLRTPRECVNTTYPPTKLQIHPNKEKMGAEEGSGEGDGKDPKDEAVCLPFPAPPPSLLLTTSCSTLYTQRS